MVKREKALGITGSTGTAGPLLGFNSHPGSDKKEGKCGKCYARNCPMAMSMSAECDVFGTPSSDRINVIAGKSYYKQRVEAARERAGRPAIDFSAPAANMHGQMTVDEWLQTLPDDDVPMSDMLGATMTHSIESYNDVDALLAMLNEEEAK